MADTAPTAPQSPARKAQLPGIRSVFAATAATAATSPTSGAQKPDIRSTCGRLADIRSGFGPRRRHKVDFCVLRLRQPVKSSGRTLALSTMSYTDRIHVSGGRHDMSEMSLPCSMKKMRHEVRLVRLISKQDLTRTRGAEIAQYRNKEERQDGTEDNDYITDDQTTTIRANVNVRLGTLQPAQRSSVCGNE